MDQMLYLKLRLTKLASKLLYYMKNYWLEENNNAPKVNWNDPAYLQWIKEIWHVEIKEEPRHLWPGQYTISGWWEDEKDLYKKLEKEWEDRRNTVWALTDSSGCLDMGGEDYFHWNVETPSWSLHKNGTWNKILINLDDWRGKDRSEYPGIYNGYEHACKTLANYCDLVAPRFALGELTDYEKHLKDFVDNYKYDI